MARLDIGDVQLFQEAAAIGMTILVSSGDTGSQCAMYDTFAHVLWPACDPWVTACGGTTITDVHFPAGMSFTQIVWNDNEGATGGGISTLFPVPPWQLEVSMPFR